MRYGFKCPLILAAAAAAVIYGITGFSFITGEEFEIPEISSVAAGAERVAAGEKEAAAPIVDAVGTAEITPTSEEVPEETAMAPAASEVISEETAKVPAADEEASDETPETPAASEVISEETTKAPATDEEASDEALDAPESGEEGIKEKEIPDESRTTDDTVIAGSSGEEDNVGESLAGDENIAAPEKQVPEVEMAAAATEKADVPTQPVAAVAVRPWENGVVHTATDTVDATYFADALFIGDSRTVGLSQYCPELDEQAEFYAKVSLTVKAALDKPFVKTEEGKKTVDEMLSDGRQFGKIYIMLGINEVAGGTDESFAADYETMINRIREKQPNAMIFIQSIMHVTKKKSDNDGHINNPRIDGRNAAIARLADAENGIYYVDINQAVDDGEGNLIGDLSFDEVHLKAVSYGLWYDFLKTHAHI